MIPGKGALVRSLVNRALESLANRGNCSPQSPALLSDHCEPNLEEADPNFLADLLAKFAGWGLGWQCGYHKADHTAGAEGYVQEYLKKELVRLPR